MQNTPQTSLSVLNQLPDFIKDENPLFERFLQAYYGSQERTGGAVGILNNLSDYFNLSKYDLKKINSSTFTIGSIQSDTKNIQVESTDNFPEENGTLLIDDEVIYYESVRKSPNVVLTPDISYEEFKKKEVILFNPYAQFDGIENEFTLKANNEPVYPPTAKHLIIKVYNEYLIPEVDYTVLGDIIRFTTPPRAFDPINFGDSSGDVSFLYLKGFQESEITVFDNIGTINTQIDPEKYDFQLKISGVDVEPASTSLIVCIIDGQLKIPLIDYSIYNNTIILEQFPVESSYIAYINAPILSVGSGCKAISVVNDDGEVTEIIVKDGGSNYRIDNTPKVSLDKSTGKNATAKALISGIKSIDLIDSGKGYSSVNPPTLIIQPPTDPSGSQAKGYVTVNTAGNVESITITNSGSGYDFIPRIQFLNPSGGVVGNCIVNESGIITSVDVLDGGYGYTVPPQIYVDEPTGTNPIQALLQANLNTEGEISSITVLSGGRGYDPINPPRVAVIQPTNAQILSVDVDSFGRVVNIDLLSGGFGYEDVPSVYIVDDRVDNLGNTIGGTGAKAVATVFNGEIIDINITSFGEGYDSDYPPKIFISSPIGAKASCLIGEGEITGFEVISSGEGYSKSEFTGCSRGVSGITGYDAEENAIYKSESSSIATEHLSGSLVTGLDAVFFKKILERLSRQYIPGLPDIDIGSINITNVIRTVKDFYASKGTKESIAYLFKILYGTDVEITYPKDQIIKPSASTWSVDTILRAKLISGDPENLRDSIIVQEADAVDTNVQFASATVENFIAIQTSQFDVYELVLSEESIVGNFVIPYKTKLAEPIDTETSIITVDSTIGWPERNGEIVVADEVIRYKEKSLTQFIECTRGINGLIDEWDAATEVTSNFYIKCNAGTAEEVVLLVLGIVESGNTQLVDESSYYLPGDKLTVSKLGSTEDTALIESWLYNVKKLVQIDTITYGGVNNQTATVTCINPHGLLVGDQVTIYGANPIVYNGTFLVTSRESSTVFKYELPQPATLNPQGNILISIDLNKGKSDVASIDLSIRNFATNVQNTFFNKDYVYVAASGIPNYKVGPFLGTSLLPGNQRKLYRFPKSPQTISVKSDTVYGSIGSFVNGISVWNYKSNETVKYGPVTAVNILNSGTNYDAGVPPVLSFSGGNGTGASGRVVVNGSVTEIEVLTPGSGYTSSPLVSISGGGGDGASATAIVTKGIVSRILVNTSGSGFTSEPTITVTGGGGSGCTARAYVRGPIKEVIIEDGGQDYTENPSVNLSSGSGAAAQVYVSNGRIISVAVISSGNGYTTAPKVVIVGEGYGAVAVANIQTEGSEAGRVTSITILNRGIGYKQGTTQIRLESIGESAVFETEIFEWTYNLQETVNYDYANGSIFEGFNTQYGGEYGHVSNPKQLRYVLGDNLTISNGEIIEKESGIVHSPILGWAFDGNPIYGPYGLSDPTNLASTIVPIKSSYTLKSNLVFEATTNPEPVRIAGPALAEYPAGTFIEDYIYNFRSEQYYLDEYNGRFCKTPDFPEGTYAYFITLDAAGNPAFPFIIGPRFYSLPDSWNLSQFAVQSNIPTGVVRYRTPFENVDVDVERSPNESTNALTLENGDILTFEIEDENRDGFVESDEQLDPDQIFEEGKLQLFDYFPKIDVSSKVDIEVETTTKFEDAKISDFLIENSGINYQVGDRLIFDDTGTEGYGASASVNEIVGEGITSHTYEYNSAQDEYFGIVQTEVPHNMVIGDIVNITTTPAMEPTSKSIYVRTIHGLENVNVVVSGLGYDPEIPVEAVIDSESGVGAKVEAIINTTGALETINILNSGRNYTEDPKIRISHPQVQKRALYYALQKTYQSDIKIYGSYTDELKNTYICGSVKSTNGDTHGFASKINNEGVTLWTKSLTSVQPGSTKRCEFVDIVKNGTNIYIIGQTYPNTPSAANFNPDILIAKYTENASGTYVTLAWQKEIAGISGVLRNDYVTSVDMYDNNIIISGYTTTNATGTNDATLLYVANTGDILTKRKVTSTSESDKFYSVKVDSNGYIYAAGQASTDKNLLVSKFQIVDNKIQSIWQKQITYTNYEFNDINLMLDEYDEIYVSSSLTNSSTTTTTSLCLVKLDSSGDLKLQLQYGIPNISILTGAKSSIDVFNEISIGYRATTPLGKDISGILKLDYRGNILNAYTIDGTKAYRLSVISTDVSGDPAFLGAIASNRSHFLFDGEDYVDRLGNVSNLTNTNGVTLTTDEKWGTNAYSIPLTGRLQASTTVSSTGWTVEGWFKYDTVPTTKIPHLITVTNSSSQSIIIQIQGSSSAPTTYGKVRLEVNGTAGSWSTSSNVLTLMNGTYAHFALTKSFANSVATYTLYIAGSQYVQVTSAININPTTINFGSTTGSASVAMKADDLRLSTYAISYTAAPTQSFNGYDYGTEYGFAMKFDKNADSVRMGNITLSNNATNITRTSITTIVPTDLTLINEPYILGADGLQVLDYNDATSFLTQDYHLPIDTYDTWSSRTATIPSPGGRKAQFETNAYGKFFFRHFSVEKFDNIRSLTLNQEYTFESGTVLSQKNSIGATIASGKIIDTDSENNILYVTDITGTFTTNSGTLESSTNAINEIEDYVFEYVDATTPGTFNISIPGGVEATFKTYSDDDYLIRIDEIIVGASYARGSVITLGSSNFSFNTARTSVTITGLSSVTQISLITNLKRTMQIDSIANTNRIFARTTTSHYLSAGDNIYTETAPVYSYADGSFFVNEVLSKKEFIFTLNSVPGSFIGSGTTLYVYVKHPVFKFIYGQQYTFDVTHVSNEGYYLSFYRDNLNKIEYTFKNIVRKGIPGRDAPGASPFISFKITDDVSNISYYADPSRIGDESPVAKTSYIDVVKSPYIGKFEITETFGGSVTVGDNKFKYKLANDPEKNALSNTSSYSTQSTKVAGSIASIRLINGGGFYKKLPVISDIQSVRKIERVEINNPGTEYEPGEYFGVPILGDGVGGKVRLVVDENTDPAGQIVEVAVTDPGKGYTTAYIDVDAVDGILGPTLSGSGAVLEVIIPPKGTGASIFVKGENVGKIKKLKNNNYGFNYTHDYTLRPEITFPANLQLINTSILSSIKVIDPGTGYTSIPEVVITGGGGSGAIAVAEIKNGRISAIIIKNPGFGYSTEPTVELKTSFTYVVNLDLGLFQMAYPHGITNGAEVTLDVEDLGQGTVFPLTSFGYIIPGQIYYAISGESAGLEDNQLRIALTPQDAESGNYISFANSGTGRQLLLTNSFGGTAEAVVETARFLTGELVYQGDSLDTASATGYVSDNDGWQIGPRILKLIDTNGTFAVGQNVTGVISKANGTIDNINAAKGVIEVNSITKTAGKFLDDVGKTNEIVQKIQDSYLYQSFSYNVKSPLSIDKWKSTIVDNAHATGFKIFGEISVSEDKKGLTDKTDFELTKSVNLIESSVVANIENFALVEPIYKEFDNTQVLFRTKRLTSSEEILTSYVQKIDDISYLFDGERTSFPLTIDGSTAIANTNQLQLVINGVSQSPGESFEVQQGSIVFNEPPPAPTKVSYAVLTLQFLSAYEVGISNISGILPELGGNIVGLQSSARATVLSSTTSTLKIFNIVGTFQPGELILSASTGLSAQLDTITAVTNENVFQFQEKITNLNGKTADIESINLDGSIQTNTIIVSKTSGTYDSPSGLLSININDYITSAKTGIVARVIGVSPYIDPTTNTPVSSISISDPSSFFGLLYNRIIQPEYPNVVIDDISKSNIEVVSLTDPTLKYESKFPEFETITKTSAEYTVDSGSGLEADEFVENIKINYINSSGEYSLNETIKVQKIAYQNLTGGNYQAGDIVTTSGGFSAPVIGVNYALKYLFLGEQTGTFAVGDTISCDKSFVTDDDIILDRNADASNLILANKLLIADVAVGRMLANYPGFTVPGGNQNCKDDIVDVLEEICFNLKYGGNHRAYDVGLLYINNAYLQNERDESVYAFNQARDMAIQAMRNETIAIGSYSLLVQFKDLTIEGDQSGQPGIYQAGDCADVASSITTLFGIVTQAIGSDATPGNLTGITRTNIGTISSVISAYLEVPFDVEQINTTTNTITTFQISGDGQHRYRDAANLIRLNATYIIEETVGRMKNLYPDLIIPGDETGGSDGTSRCKLDLSLLLDAVVTDLEYGGNYNTLGAGRFYLDENGSLRFITLQVLQSIYAHTQMNLLCQQAVDGTLSDTPEYTNEIPVNPLGITIDPGGCADVKSDIDTLWNLINEVIGPTGDVYKDASNALWFNRDFISEEAVGKTTEYFKYFLNGIQYSAFDYPDGTNGENTCKRDLADYIIPSIIADLISGGDANTISAMTFYLDGTDEITHVKDELLPTIYALEQTNILCQYAIDNWRITGTATVYTPQFANVSDRYIDNTITVDDGTYGTNCARIKSAIDTLFTKAIGVLLPERDQYILSGRHYDAANLIESNKLLIADVAVGRMLTNYPGFTVPNGNQNCKDDIIDILDTLCFNLRFGGNHKVYDAAEIYITNAGLLSGEQTQSVYAFNQARDMAIEAMRNQTISIGGYSTRTQVKDLTITADPLTGSNTSASSCANVASTITTLMAIVTQAVQNGNLTGITRTTDSTSNKAYRDAAKLILFNKNYFKEEIVAATQAQYPSFNFGATSSSGAQPYKVKCKRDIGYIVDAIVYDLLTYGNSGIYDATTAYIDAATGTIISLQGELVQSIYAYGLLKTYLKSAIAETLVSPSPYTTYYTYTDNNINLTTTEKTELNSFIDARMDILLNTLNNSTYLETSSVIRYNSLSIPNSVYPTRTDITGISGKLITGDYIYGETSGVFGEVETINQRTAVVKNVLKRLEIVFDNDEEQFSAGDSVSKQGATSNNGIVFSHYYDENFNFIDVEMNNGVFSIGDILINDDGYTATIADITDKVQFSKLIGEFENNDKLKQFSSNTVFQISQYENVSAPVLDNTGSKLTLDTESYFGDFEVTDVIYSNSSDLYIDTNYALGIAIGLGDLVQTKVIYKIQVTLSASENQFPIGYTINDSSILTNTAVVVAFIPDDPETPTTADIYVGNLGGDFFSIGNNILCYEPGNNFPIGIADVTNAQIIDSESYGFISKIETVGTGYRYYLSGVKGQFNQYAQLLGRFGYKSLITDTDKIVGRIKRSFRGFDGQQDTFNLTILNGTQYLPNPDGHLLVFLNGILQPPITSYVTFSDVIQFSEPPDIGSSFHSVYIGKLRQLDDISFEFDSLRNSFNLRLNEVFYSLTVTSGAESTNIKPDNNIIVSLNGVIQEPGVAFELVGSRIIFAEIPRAGSSFVAFSYIGSDADVIAKTIIPPIETGDELEIEGEDKDRTVAIIESSNSLVTFDYTGSVFGRNASALVNIISGRISNLSITSPGNGYTSRPAVSLDSSTGFDGQIKALVGVSRVDIINRGSGYSYPTVEIDYEVSEIQAALIFDSTTTKLDSELITFDET
jgi:YHYH protein